MRDSRSISDWLGYLSYGEIDLLKSLAQLLPDDPLVVNIGAGGGTSGLTFVESRPDLHLVTIDIQDEASPTGCLAAERLMMEEAGFSRERFQQIHGDSKEVGKTFAKTYDLQADMVFIDGDHSYEGVCGDIKIWMKNLRPGGILAVHDYHRAEWLRKLGEDPAVRGYWEGVNRAVDDLLVKKYKEVGRIDTTIAFRKSVPRGK